MHVLMVGIMAVPMVMGDGRVTMPMFVIFGQVQPKSSGHQDRTPDKLRRNRFGQ